jgi:hypothetical protein
MGADRAVRSAKALRAAGCGRCEPVARRFLSRILHDADAPGHGEVLVPATLVGSSATAALHPVGPERARELAEVAERGGGLWVVKGERWARVLTAEDLLAERIDPLTEREAPRLFDGEPARALLADDLDPVDLVVPVQGWEPGSTFYYHRESPRFAHVPVLRKLNHKVTVIRGDVSDQDRKLIGRRMVEGQTCGVLANELGGLCVVPDGEVATDVRALHAERVRFIVDGLRDLTATAKVLREWSGRFADAADAGWVLERPIDNSFVYAVNRRRLRTLLPVPAAGALVPVGVAVDLPRPADDGAGPDPAGFDGGPDGGLDGDAVAVAGGDPAPPAGLPDLETAAPLAAVAVATAPPAPPDPTAELARRLVEHLARGLMERAPAPPPDHPRAPDQSTLAVLRRNVFRRPRGRLLRADSGGRLVVALVRIRLDGVIVLQGHLPDDAASLIAAAVADDPLLVGDWGLCRGAFGYVLAEMGAPLRAIESLSSSVSYAHLLDGCVRLDEAAARLGAVAEQLERLAADGWTLDQPIAGFWLRLRPATPFF